MVRRIRNCLLIFLTAVCLPGTWVWHRSKDHAPVKDAIDNDDIANTTREKFFLLPNDDWMTFRIPSTAMSVRVFSRANTLGDIISLAHRDIPYQITYQLETVTGKLRDKGEFSYITNVIPGEDTFGETRQGNFFPNRSWIPLSARTSLLEGNDGDFVLLKLKAPASAPNVESIVVRVSYRQKVPDRKLKYDWDRLQEEKRVELASASVHGAAGLSAGEKRSLLENRWTPLAPQGVSGHDFEELFLYTRTDIKVAFLPEVGVPKKNKLIAAKGLIAVVGIPEEGKYRFEFEATGIPKEIDMITFRSYGATIHERATFDRLIIENGAVTIDIPAGLIEIETTEEYQITVTKDGLELEQPPTIVRGWIAGPNDTVTIPCGDGAIIKLVARRLDPDSESVALQWTGQGNTFLQTVKLVEDKSLFDRAIDGEEDYSVYEKNEFVLSPPEWATSLEVGSAERTLLNFYSRPEHLKHRTNVPSDYQRALPDPDRQPIWFGVRPFDFEERIRDFRSLVLKIQTRPPEDNEDILASRYLWEDFDPSVNSRGHYLFEPRDFDIPIRDEAMATAFLEIPVNQDVKLMLSRPFGMELPTRRFVYFKPDTQPVQFKVYVDGDLLHSQSVAAENGEILLPPIPYQSRIINVEASGEIQLFLNYVDLVRASHIKRFAQRVKTGERMEFLVEKRTPEVELATGRFYLPTDYDGSHLKAIIRIIPVDPKMVRLASDGYTPEEREYYLEPPTETKEVSILGGPFPTAKLWQKFFIPLGPDLPTGAYRIVVKYTEGPEGYFILSKVTGGVYPKSRFSREAIR